MGMAECGCLVAGARNVQRRWSGIVLAALPASRPTETALVALCCHITCFIC